MDPLGTTLSIPGLVLLIYGLTSGNIIDWDSGAVIGTLVAAVLLLVGFVFRGSANCKQSLGTETSMDGG